MPVVKQTALPAFVVPFEAAYVFGCISVSMHFHCFRAYSRKYSNNRSSAVVIKAIMKLDSAGTPRISSGIHPGQGYRKARQCIPTYDGSDAMPSLAP